MIVKEQPKIVIIGGGTGLPVLIRGLKQYPVDITAIVTVADDGGSSGRLRNGLNIPPPGDIRNVLVALAETEPLIEEMFQHRFPATDASELSGHSLGNLILAAMISITGDFVHAIQEMSKVLNVKGKVLPAANQSVELHAEMSDGSIISGESKIPQAGKPIKRVFLSPHDVEALPETIHAIRQADLIVIGPGSLYTSILPNLLVPKLGMEVCRSKAKKVYVCNVMTQAGETTNFTASDHVKVLYEHLRSRFIDTIIVNNKQIPAHILKRYHEENARQVHSDYHNLYQLGLHVIDGDLVTFRDKIIRHDTNRLAEVLYSMLFYGKGKLYNIHHHRF